MKWWQPLNQRYESVLKIPAFSSVAADSKCLGPIQLGKMPIRPASEMNDQN